jgi:hypothetical protein
MIEANTRLFAKLADAAGAVVTPELRAQKRALRTTKEEKKWLQLITLRTSPYLLLGSTSKLALGEYENSLYLISIGAGIFDPPPELEQSEVNAGMFTAIASELDVPIVPFQNLADRLLEYVFYPVEDQVELVELDIILPFFYEVRVFRVDPGSALVLDKELGLRAAVAAVAGSTSVRPLAWPASALARIAYMARDPNERAPFHLLLRALTETRDDAAFMAVYRCVEQLFPIPAISELCAELKVGSPALIVAATLERHLGWRRREEDAIPHLFDGLDADLVNRLLSVVGAEAKPESRTRPVAKRVYELRNQCVHYRPVHAVDSLGPPGSWLALADLMLEVVQTLYAQYAGAFNSSTGADAMGSTNLEPAAAS